MGDVLDYRNAQSGHAVVVIEKTDEYVKVTESGANNPYMFSSPVTGEMYYPSSVAKHHEKIPKNIGLEHIRIHDSRHMFATLALQNGVDTPSHLSSQFWRITTTSSSKRQSGILPAPAGRPKAKNKKAPALFCAGTPTSARSAGSFQCQPLALF